MRIVSNKKDYYDCIQAHGQDRTLVYVRKQEEVSFKRRLGRIWYMWPFPSSYSLSSWDSGLINQYIIGFCGKIYPVVEFMKYEQKRKHGVKCFTLEDIDAFVEGHFKSKNKRQYQGQGRWSRFRSGIRRFEVAQYFEHCEKKMDSFSHMFQEKLCPIFVADERDGKITYNALLRPFEFVRVFDPYTAFQEIAMFMGAMAMPEKDMPVISDELKLRSKGFSDQSFRSQFKDSRRIPK